MARLSDKIQNGIRNADAEFLNRVLEAEGEDLYNLLDSEKTKVSYRKHDRIPAKETIIEHQETIKELARQKLVELKTPDVEAKIREIKEFLEKEENKVTEESAKDHAESKLKEINQLNKQFQTLLQELKSLNPEYSLEEEKQGIIDNAKKFSEEADQVVKKYNAHEAKIDDMNFIAVHTNNPFGFGYKKMDAGENIFAHAGQQGKNPEAASELAQEKADEIESAPVYKGHLIKKDEAIVATKAYDDKAKGILKQFPNGKVSNFSEGPLSNENKNEIAMQQVAMLVANYNPDKGKIILRGHDKEMVKKVYAGLLLASKELGVDRKNIDSLVDVRVPDVKPGWTTSYDSFIKSNLGDGGFLGFNKKIVDEERKGRTIEGAAKIGSHFKDRLSNMKSEAKKTINEDVEENLQTEAKKEINLGPK